MADEPRPTPDDRPSEAVLDELLRAFAADDPSAGADIDLDSPEVAALLSGELSRPSTQAEPEPQLEGEASSLDDDPDPSAEGGPVIESDEVTPPAPEPVSPQPEQEHATPPEPIDPLLREEAERQAATHASQNGDGGGSPDGGRVIQISADDDLPDAVYVEGDLERDEAARASTVFIDDGAADVGEIVGSAEAARATGIEPKLRERRIAVRRAEGRKRLRWMVLAVVLLLIVVAGLAVLGSSIFSIKDVTVSGAVNSRGDALDRIVADLDGEAVLRVDTDDYERRIEQIPWVKRARVTTKFPSSARIEIAERQPVATFQGEDGRYRVIDEQGRVLGVMPGQPVEYLLVTTDSPPNTAAGEYAPNGFAAAGLLARVLTPTMRQLVDSIVVAADGSDVRLLLEGGTEVVLGDGERLVDKLVRLETVISNDPLDLPTRIDVSTDEVTITP
jgi:cell division protein FtsQ